MSDIRADTYTGARNITVSDASNDPAGPFAALFVGAAGSVKVHTQDGFDITFPGVLAGSYLRINCTRVWSTGTTVTTPNTNIIGLKGYPIQAT